VPLNDAADFADWVGARGWPVLLVVGMRLGCVSHALLTAESIRARGLHLAGWVANELPPRQDRLDENIRSIAGRVGAPLLGRIATGGTDAGEVFASLRSVLA
jgi:dethiobiotin synthetase